MHKTLIVVDAQNDFITGALGSEKAQEVLINIRKKIQECREKGYKIIFTMDTHDGDYFETIEGKNLPIMHCRFKFKGWELADGLFQEGDRIVYKDTFGTLAWGKMEDLGDVEIIGYCTNICVISNALIIKSLSEYFDVIVDSSCCCGTSEEEHNMALQIMKCNHVKVI